MLDTLPLTLDQSNRDYVRKYIYGTNSFNKVCTVNNHDIVYSDIIRLQRPTSRHQYLNDNIINAYMSILQKDNDDRCKQESGKLKSIIYNTHFFFRLFDGGETQEFRYENVSRWWKSVDIFSLNKMFFPVHIKIGFYEHWTLVVVAVQQKRIDYYDSCGGNGEYWVKGVLEYISLKWKDKNDCIPFNRQEWKMNYSSSHNVPQQTNGWDCGVFICLYTYLLLQEKELLFSQSQVNEHVREKIALSILKGKLIK